MTDKIVRVCLWSGPRNISTALMYSFAQRNDTTVFDEPLYAHYLSRTPAKEYHPGSEEVIKTMENDGEKVVHNLILGDQTKPVAFFKQMTHHLVDLKLDFLSETINVLLTRDPIDMLPSYVQQVEKPTLKDVGYKAHIDLLNYLNSIGQNPPILDSKQLLLNPKIVLTKLCKQIGIPFQDSMLSWKAGPRAEDGSWAKYWYKSVHKSTGFSQYVPKTDPFPEELKHLLKVCKPYYEQLSTLAIKA